MVFVDPAKGTCGRRTGVTRATRVWMVTSQSNLFDFRRMRIERSDDAPMIMEPRRRAATTIPPRPDPAPDLFDGQRVTVMISSVLFRRSVYRAAKVSPILPSTAYLCR
jgi:hypothetical protein